MEEEKHNKKLDEIKKQEVFFDNFYKKAKDIFEKLCNSDKSSQIYQKRCKLIVCPGGRFGGTDPSVVEVFWGYQPINGKYAHNEYKIKTELGVTILFNLLLDGHVSITLFPAKVENMRPIEDCIFLCNSCKASWLLKEKNQKQLWSDFMSYTECTSLLGTPSLYQKIRIKWLKCSHTIYVNNIRQPICLYRYICWFISFIFTVGLSGFLLLVVQIYFEKEPFNYVPILEENVTKIDTLIYKNGLLLNELKTINENTDSLVKSQINKQ